MAHNAPVHDNRDHRGSYPQFDTVTITRDNISQAAASDPHLRRFPTDGYIRRNLTAPLDITVKDSQGFAHARCPYAAPNHPHTQNLFHGDSLVVAVDGACAGDDSSMAVGVLIWHDYQPDPNLWYYSSGLPGITQQRADVLAAMSGILMSLDFIRDGGQWVNMRDQDTHGGICRVKHIIVKSDSEYLVNGMTDPRLVKKWQEDDWVTDDKQPVPNQYEWEQLIVQVKEAEDRGAFVSFWLVERAENEEAHSLAKGALEKGSQASEGAV